MSSDAGRPVAPLTSVGRVEPHPPPGFVLRRDDYGAFRAVEPGTSDLLVFRAAADGLVVERREGRELIPWAAIVGLTLTFVEAGRAKVPAVRVQLTAGPSLDYADALAPGADDLPLTLGPGQNHLLRVERCRMLTAVIASAAGLAPATTHDFRRGPRGVDVPELAVRPRVLPRWLPPLGLPLSVVAFVAVFGARWTTAVAVTCVLVLHELGHAAAMRLARVPVRGFLFVPLFGAATLPEHSFSSRWDEARVALAGPATGLPTAGAIAVLFVEGPQQYHGALGVALLWALGVNVLNLIPVLPLDGGRVLATLTAALPPAARATLAFLPIVASASLAVLLLRGNVLLGTLVFLAFAASLTRMSLRRQVFHGWMERLPQPLAAVRASLRDVTHALGGGVREDVDGGVAMTPLTSAQVVAIVVAYAAVAGLLFAAVVAFVAAFPGVLDVFGSGW